MNQDPVPHESAVALQQSAALTATFAELASQAASLEADCRSMESCTLSVANRTRVMGLTIATALNRQQMKFEHFEAFFREHAAQLPGWLDSEAAKRMLAVYRAHPEEITDLKVAVQVMTQQTFFALGWFEETTRALPQTATGRAPLELFTQAAAKERESLQKLIDVLPIAQWDERTWRSVAMATKDSAAMHARAQAALARRK